MGDTSSRPPFKNLKEQDRDLDPARFAYISDSTYTPEQIEQMTACIVEAIPCVVKDSPNAKMFLRSFWYRARQGGVVDEDEMHIYALGRYVTCPCH